MNRLYFTDLEALNYQITGILPYVKVVDNFDAEYEVRLEPPRGKTNNVVSKRI